MNNPRNITIDVARGLGMLAIVWGHNTYVLNPPEEMFRVVFSFHVPLFFALAGAMLRTDTTTWAHLSRRAPVLLQPYAVVLICLAVVGTWKQWRSGGDWVAHALAHLQGMAWGTGSTLPWPPLWFLPQLLLASVVTLLWLKACNRLQPDHATLPLWTALPLLAGGIAVLGHMEPKGLPWSLDVLPLSVACMLTGYALRKRMAAPNLSLPVLLAMATAFAALHLVWDVTIDLSMRHYGQPLVATAQVLLGIACVMGVSERIARAGSIASPVAYFGRHSLAVLLFHRYVQDALSTILLKATRQPVLSAAVSFVAACTVPLLIWAIAARWSIARQLLMPGTAPSRGH